ncbi:hypothetical protein V8J88_09875 [Massilia sp. W12]|uniref:hypothetical protein n=1 Tax=Massilia sp. W12 TaxID=3126507 RepID=UPI0030D3F34C
MHREFQNASMQMHQSSTTLTALPQAQLKPRLASYRAMAFTYSTYRRTTMAFSGKLTTLSKLFVAATLTMGTIASAAASVTFHYTGNPFSAQYSNPSLSGKHIVGSVTFDDSVRGFTGEVGQAAIQSWSIGVANTPSIQFNSTANATDSNWPLWFRFDQGVITGWQFLARESTADQFPEIYTTHNSPYSYILSTGDYYSSDRSNRMSGLNINSAGVWAAPVPETSSALMMLAGLGVLLTSMRKRVGAIKH